jgi:hypothetical protein
MAIGRLTAGQVEILRALARIIPRWRLFGGAALAGFYTRHRGTRDLDLLWERSDLASVGDQVERRLAEAGMAVEVIQRAPAFRRFRVKHDEEIVVLDLVAEPMQMVDAPLEQTVGGERILVDSPHEILVSKLTALLGRSELRDLEDVQVLLAAGGDLKRAIADAPRKDAGFSPATLAWLLEQFPVEHLGRALQREPGDIEALKTFRERLVGDLLALTKPA